MHGLQNWLEIHSDAVIESAVARLSHDETVKLQIADAVRIFFDAFAPDVQPELWTKDVFKKMYDFLKIGGILVTYCAKGVVKRTIKEVGFELETLAGPPGKREMIRSSKSEVGSWKTENCKLRTVN